MMLKEKHLKGVRPCTRTTSEHKDTTGAHIWPCRCDGAHRPSASHAQWSDPLRRQGGSTRDVRRKRSCRQRYGSSRSDLERSAHASTAGSCRPHNSGSSTGSCRPHNSGSSTISCATALHHQAVPHAPPRGSDASF